METVFTDAYFMKQALLQAQNAFDEGEVPIGAVVVSQNQIIGRGYNQVEKLADATAHAEMLALTAAAAYLGTKYLTECTIYITIEPCPMCAGALYWARIGRVVYGANEPKFGFHSRKMPLLHPQTSIIQGVLEEECRSLMQNFFKNKRE
jgi:tRNA(adenine34) deaminase